MVWNFIGVFIPVYKTLHGRLDIRNFSSRVKKKFSTLEEKFSISARPCNIFYLFLDLDRLEYVLACFHGEIQFCASKYNFVCLQTMFLVFTSPSINITDGKVWRDARISTAQALRSTRIKTVMFVFALRWTLMLVAFDNALWRRVGTKRRPKT